MYENYIQWRKTEEGQDNLPPDLKDDCKGDKLRWSYCTKLPGEQMLPFLREQMFHFLRNLGAETSSFTQYMQDAVFIIPKASLLQEATQIIESMHISGRNAEVQGDIHEYLLNQLSTSGKNGQFSRMSGTTSSA